MTDVLNLLFSTYSLFIILAVAASWLSVGSSYQEPLVTVNTGNDLKTVILTANKNEFSVDTDLGSDISVNGISGNHENRGKESNKRKKDYKDDKKNKKSKSRSKKRREKDNEDKHGEFKYDKKGNKGAKNDSDKIRKIAASKDLVTNNILDNNYSYNNKNNNDSNNNNDNDNDDVYRESDSDTDWSSDDSNSNTNTNTYTKITSHNKKSKNSHNNNNNNTNQLIISNKNEIQETRNLVFLPDGKILLTEMKKSSNLGVGWITDVKGDNDIKLHGIYKPDVPVYPLYTGNINLLDKINLKFDDNDQIENYKNSKKSSSSSKNSNYLNSITLAKKTHKLPTGLIMSSENGPIFRPKEKTVLEHKFGKTEILREIRLKKKNRFYLGGKYQKLSSSSSSSDGKEKGDSKRKDITVDVLSDVNLNRIRFDNIKKRKNQNIISNENKSESENENKMHYDISGHLIIGKTSASAKNDTLVPYSSLNFLNSEYLPLPTQTLANIDTEFVNENTDFKTVKTVEIKRNYAAIFGFGNNSEYETLKNQNENLDKNDVKLMEKKKEVIKVFFSDSEVFFIMFITIKTIFF